MKPNLGIIYGLFQEDNSSLTTVAPSFWRLVLVYIGNKVVDHCGIVPEEVAKMFDPLASKNDITFRLTASLEVSTGVWSMKFATRRTISFNCRLIINLNIK